MANTIFTRQNLSVDYSQENTCHLALALSRKAIEENQSQNSKIQSSLTFLVLKKCLQNDEFDAEIRKNTDLLIKKLLKTAQAKHHCIH